MWLFTKICLKEDSEILDHNNSNLRQAFEGLQKIETLSDDEAREFLDFLNTYLTRYAHLETNPALWFLDYSSVNT